MIIKLFRCERFLSPLTSPMGVLILMFMMSLLSCEKDDVCNEGTPGTPRLIIRFYDHENPTAYKGLPGVFVQEVKQEKPIFYTEFDSIAIPLDLSLPATRYAFVLSSATDSVTIADTLDFHVQDRWDIYSRRACGYSANYRLGNPPVSAINSPTWFIRAEKITDTINNEERAHLAIYH